MPLSKYLGVSALPNGVILWVFVLSQHFRASETVKCSQNIKWAIYAPWKLEGDHWTLDLSLRLASTRVSPVWYPHTQEEEQNVFRGIIVNMSIFWEISYKNDNSGINKIKLNFSKKMGQKLRSSKVSPFLLANTLGCLLCINDSKNTCAG